MSENVEQVEQEQAPEKQAETEAEKIEEQAPEEKTESDNEKKISENELNKLSSKIRNLERQKIYRELGLKDGDGAAAIRKKMESYEKKIQGYKDEINKNSKREEIKKILKENGLSDELEKLIKVDDVKELAENIDILKKLQGSKKEQVTPVEKRVAPKSGDLTDVILQKIKGVQK